MTAVGAPDVAALVPHAGTMVLLEGVERWDAGTVRCWTRTHLRADNPLRRGGRVSAVSGLEYALQAAALHGALLAGGVAQRAGYVARLRDVVLGAAFLPEAGVLVVEAVLERGEASGMLYGLRVLAGEAVLVSGRATVALPA